MKISRFPDCCTSLILSSIPYNLTSKTNPLVYGTERTLYYLFDDEYADRHYCNIHAILTDNQIRNGCENVLTTLGFKKVNSSQKYKNGGERDTGNLNTYVARWQDFRSKIRDTIDTERDCTRLKTKYNKYEDPYTYERIKNTLPMYSNIYKMSKDMSNSRTAFNFLTKILGLYEVEDNSTRYKLFNSADIFRVDDIRLFWKEPTKGVSFYKYLAGKPTYQDYQKATNILIERYELDLPKYKI